MKMGQFFMSPPGQIRMSLDSARLRYEVHVK
jgi:hypothetical protein